MHGPKPRSHAIKLQKKVRRLGLKIALSARTAEGKVFANILKIYALQYGHFCWAAILLLYYKIIIDKPIAIFNGLIVCSGKKYAYYLDIHKTSFQCFHMMNFINDIGIIEEQCFAYPDFLDPLLGLQAKWPATRLLIWQIWA